MALPAWGFEIGNELDDTYSGSDGVDPYALGADLGAVAAAIRAVWPAEDTRPVLLAQTDVYYGGGACHIF